MSDKLSAPKSDRTPMMGSPKPKDSGTTVIGSENYPVEGGTVLNQAWIARQPTEALVNLMVAIALEIKARKGPQETEQIANSSGKLKFPSIKESDIQSFERAPANLPADSKKNKPGMWRIILSSPYPKHRPAGFDIVDDAVLGRGDSSGAKPDIDLAHFDADDYGVSRRHAMLKPTNESLYLIDLSSTNGTRINNQSIGPTSPLTLSDGDVITVGGLSLRVTIIKKPGKEA